MSGHAEESTPKAEATSSTAGREPGGSEEDHCFSRRSVSGHAEEGTPMAEATSSTAGREPGGSEEDQRAAVLRLFESSKSLSILTVGKSGAGKSSLVGDLLGIDSNQKPPSRAGMEPVTTAIEHYEILVGDVAVKIYDTPGLFDVSGRSNESETLRTVGEFCNNDVDGVLLICIEMHQRVDKSTMETLALIHRRCGKEIWRFAVIALTKADRYPASVWLKSKRWWQREEPILEEKFKEDLAAAQDYLKSLFTSTDVTSECCIGLTQEEFDDLAIPILPTSKLCYKTMSAMEMVGQKSWFDKLLVECCKREGGMALMKIHSKRLWQLPKEVLVQLAPNGIFGPYLVDFLRDVVSSLSGKTVAWKMH